MIVVRPPEERRGSQRGPAHPERCVNAACKALLIGRFQWKQGIRPEGHVSHQALGLCVRCYGRWRRNGTLELVGHKQPIQGRREKALPRSREEVLADYMMIRDDVDHVRQAAERMGMTLSALDRALYRARKDGDPRGNAPASQVDRAHRLNVRLPIAQPTEGKTP